MVIVGIDEVGRGSWAGPLVAGAVILENTVVGVKDSKLLTKKVRERLALDIASQAEATGLGWVTNTEIDTVGLTLAVALAMKRALAEIKIAYDQVIIDGNYNFLAENPMVVTMVRADFSVPAVSAASIIAKVARDNYMRQAAKRYPDYSFDTHVGYGTQVHRNSLNMHGPCSLHRNSYKPVMAAGL